MVRWLRLVFGPRRPDQPWNDAVHGDAVFGKVMRQSTGEADYSGLRRHYMCTIFRSRMRAQAADVNDRSSTGFAQGRKTGLYAVERTVEGNVEDFPPLGIVH